MTNLQSMHDEVEAIKKHEATHAAPTAPAHQPLTVARLSPAVVVPPNNGQRLRVIETKSIQGPALATAMMIAQLPFKEGERAVFVKQDRRAIAISKRLQKQARRLARG